MIKVARIYIRVSTEEQDLTRQHELIKTTEAQGYYIAKVYKEKASGATENRPELNSMIEDLQPGEVVVAENIDRISRLPLPEAEKLIARIKEKGASFSIPGLLDLSQIDVGQQNEIGKIVLGSLQDMLMKIALQIARDDYETRRLRQAQGIKIAKAGGKYKGKAPNLDKHRQIMILRSKHMTISDIAKMVGVSTSSVTKILKKYSSAADVPLGEGK